MVLCPVPCVFDPVCLTCCRERQFISVTQSEDGCFLTSNDQILEMLSLSYMAVEAGLHQKATILSTWLYWPYLLLS